MNESVWLTLFVIAVGTFLIRTVPLQIMFRRLKKSDSINTSKQIPVVLSIMGPAMIAAMLGSSLIPSKPSFVSLTATLAGIIVTLATYYKFRTLSVPVLLGVVGYSVVILIFGNP